MIDHFDNFLHRREALGVIGQKSLLRSILALARGFVRLFERHPIKECDYIRSINEAVVVVIVHVKDELNFLIKRRTVQSIEP